MDLIDIKHIFNQFVVFDTFKNYQVLTAGHINDTYKIETDSGNAFILQRINTNVFTDAEALINNKISISTYLNNKSKYVVPQFVKTHTNNWVFIDDDKKYWTLCKFIKNTKVFLIPKSKNTAKEAGKILGNFHKSIRYYDIGLLFKTIPNFHNLTYREKQFKDAKDRASAKMLKEVIKEIELIDAFRAKAKHLDELKTSGSLPLRATHNDAKLSNILFDESSQNAVAIIDFDTIMPGIIHYDIGDAIRSICATANEDEADITKIGFNLNYYNSFLEGFLTEIRNELTALEKDTITLSMYYMLYEQSLRFLSDYLNGNTYYKIEYPKQNLVRAKNQLRLLEIINQQSQDIKNITERLLTNF